MAAKGTIAKQNVIKKLQDLYGANFIGTENNKTYIWEDDDGEKVQIAITLTCPKTPIAANAPTVQTNNSIEINADERNEIEELMKRLNL